jgi:hypothetical protein
MDFLLKSKVDEEVIVFHFWRFCVSMIKHLLATSKIVSHQIPDWKKLDAVQDVLL